MRYILLLAATVSVVVIACSSEDSLPDGAPPRQEPGDDWREIVTYAPAGPGRDAAIAFAITVPPHWVYDATQGFDSLAGHLGPSVPGDYVQGHLNFDFAGNAGPVVPFDQRDTLIRWDWELDPAIQGELFRPPGWNGYVGADLTLPTVDHPQTNLFIAGPVDSEASGIMLLTALRSIRPCFPANETESCELPAEAR